MNKGADQKANLVREQTRTSTHAREHNNTRAHEYTSTGHESTVAYKHPSTYK